ncbi:Hsp20 family protein, partial [Klebsiella pneumoniae]
EKVKRTTATATMNSQQNQNRVPVHVRNFYRDETRPVRIFNQHFGNGVNPDDYTSTLPVANYYRGHYQGYGRRESGISELRIDSDRFFVLVDLQHFSADETNVRTFDGYLYVEAYHEEREDEHGLVTRRLVRKYHLPEGLDVEQLNAYFTTDGVLIVSGPKQPIFEQQGRNDRRISITQTGQPSANLQQQQYSKKK